MTAFQAANRAARYAAVDSTPVGRFNFWPSAAASGFGCSAAGSTREADTVPSSGFPSVSGAASSSGVWVSFRTRDSNSHTRDMCCRCATSSKSCNTTCNGCRYAVSAFNVAYASSGGGGGSGMEGRSAVFSGPFCSPRVVLSASACLSSSSWRFFAVFSRSRRAFLRCCACLTREANSSSTHLNMSCTKMHSRPPSTPSSSSASVIQLTTSVNLQPGVSPGCI